MRGPDSAPIQVGLGVRPTTPESENCTCDRKLPRVEAIDAGRQDASFEYSECRTSVRAAGPRVLGVERQVGWLMRNRLSACLSVGKRRV